MIGAFNLDGSRRRERDRPCQHCGATIECDECWEHTSDWSPFIIFPCFICQMPNVVVDGGYAPMRCEFCGADEAEFTSKGNADG